jgi:hypothetical protein
MADDQREYTVRFMLAVGSRWSAQFSPDGLGVQAGGNGAQAATGRVLTPEALDNLGGQHRQAALADLLGPALGEGGSCVWR